jgi:hypothetical protein
MNSKVSSFLLPTSIFPIIQQAVVIQINEWQEVIKQLEMLDDIEAYDKAKKHKSEAIPFKQAIKEIKNH